MAKIYDSPIPAAGLWTPPIRPIRTSAKAIILNDGHILLLRRKLSNCFDYILPGGGQNPGENLPDALVRECLEEAGVRVKVGSLRFVREYIGKNHARPNEDADFHQVELWFECTLLDGITSGVSTVPDHLQDGIEWVALSKLETISIVPSILKNMFLEGILQWAVVYLGDIL